MNAAIIKNTLRKVWKTKGRFLAITAIIAIGSGFFTGVKLTGPSMKVSARQYFNQTDLMDFRFASTVGFSQSDVESIAEFDGVTVAEPGYCADFFYKTDDRFDSIIKVYSYNEAYQINKPTQISGKMPQGDNECVIDNELADIFSIGSTITLAGSDDMPLDSNLAYDEFTVVGTVDWSLYIDFERGSTTLGNGKVNAFMLVPEQAFTSQAYSAVYVKCAELEGIDPFSDEYKDICEEKGLYFEDCAKLLAEKKAQTIYDNAVNDADLVNAAAEYEKGLADYNSAYSEYEKQLSDLEVQITNTNGLIADYTAQIESANAEYQSKSAEYNTAIAQLEESENSLNERQEQANLDEQLALSEQAAIDEIYPIINDYWLKSAEKPYPQALEDALEKAKQLDSETVILSTALENFATASPSTRSKTQAKNVLDNVIELKENLVADELERIEAERTDIAAMRSENEMKSTILAQSKAELDSTKAAIDTKQAELDEYIEQVSLMQGQIEDINTQSQAMLGESKKALDKAKSEIDSAYAQIDELCDSVEWYSFDRNSNIGYADFETNADRVDSIAKVFPIFFIIVAILVCFTTMARMVEEERVEIGTLKALGYSAGSIFAQYIAYAASASIIGTAVGISIGVSVIPKVIYMAYLLMYILPDLQLAPITGYVIGSVAAALACTVLAVLFSCTKALCEVPASLMRPKSPKNGKRVLLEKVGFIWKRLSFNAKVTARNVFRFKSRVIMTVIGICGCTALLLAGFTLKYAISAIVDKQFVEIFKYDAIVYHDDKVEESELYSALESSESVADYTSALQKSCQISANGKAYDGYVVVPQQADAIGQYINLRDKESGNAINLTGAGAVINEKLAQVLDIQIGDEIEIGQSKTKVKVAAIAENYTFNYVYMTKTLYASLFDDEKPNVVYANLAQGNDGSTLFAELSDNIGNGGTLNVTLTKDSGKAFRDLVDTLDYIVIVIIAASGALALVVLYNLNNINIVERMRELATLKVLGFRDGELSAYIYRETTITAVLGALFGLFVGTFFTKFVVRTAEVDVVMFARDIPLYCYLLAFAITLLFVAAVDVIMHIKLKNIDMASSMKAVE